VRQASARESIHEQDVEQVYPERYEMKALRRLSERGHLGAHQRTRQQAYESALIAHAFPPRAVVLGRAVDIEREQPRAPIIGLHVREHVRVVGAETRARGR
jgi:hypothetical protein